MFGAFKKADLARRKPLTQSCFRRRHRPPPLSPFPTQGEAIEGILSALDEGRPCNIWDSPDPHFVATLLLVFLERLPDPLFTFRLFQPFMTTATASPPGATRLVILHTLFTCLPYAHARLARSVLLHLSRVAAASENNMDARAIAESVALSCFRKSDAPDAEVCLVDRRLREGDERRVEAC